jgi:hypothetical protein
MTTSRCLTFAAPIVPHWPLGAYKRGEAVIDVHCQLDVSSFSAEKSDLNERKVRVMRKVIASTLSAAALVVASLSLTATPAFADPDLSQLCSQYGDFGLSHGACVSFVESNGNSGAIFPSVCKEIQQQYPVAFNTVFKNVGDCVSSLQRQPTPTPMV